MSSSRFDIKKFCEGNSCPRVSYNKVVTGGNDPTMSTKMRYSQYVQSQKTRNVSTIIPTTFKIDKTQPYYYFPLTQVREKVNTNL